MKKRIVQIITIACLLSVCIYVGIESRNTGDTESPVDTGQGETYESFRDFPYEDMGFVNDEAYEYIRTAYEQIDFASEFPKGNEDEYAFYKDKYRQLLDNEVAFWDSEQEEEVYLRQFSRNYGDDSGIKSADYSKYKLYFFDMDSDGTPELCIEGEAAAFLYIFKYDVHSDRMVLWNAAGGSWMELLGSRKVCWNWEGERHSLQIYDKWGEVETVVDFMEENFFSNGGNVHLVALPRYTDEQKELVLPQEIEAQGYYDKEAGEYYFAVTEEQYSELTAEYFEALDAAGENCKKVCYTYEELFSDIQDTEDESVNQGSNPYFYDKEEIWLKANADYDAHLTEPGYPHKEIDLRISLVKAFEAGSLYHMYIDAEAALEDLAISDPESRLNIYFYVTEDKIYRLWSWMIEDDTVHTFYDDDEALLTYLDTEEKIIANSELVCQEEKLAQDTENGNQTIHACIEKVGNQVIYSRYDEKVNGDPDYQEAFQWEEGKGLVYYGSQFSVGRDLLYLSNIREVTEEDETEQPELSEQGILENEDLALEALNLSRYMNMRQVKQVMGYTWMEAFTDENGDEKYKMQYERGNIQYTFIFDDYDKPGYEFYVEEI